MRTITICGSMRFEKEMQRIAFELAPADMAILEEAQLKRIELSDAIYVMDIDGYIGDMTQKEINYAKKNGKEVILHSDRR